MPWELSEEQLMLRDLARRIARERIAPRAAEIDRTGEYPWDIRQVFVDTGLIGMMLPREYGGLGASTFDTCMVIEEIGHYDTGCAGLILNQGLAVQPLVTAGTAVQKQRWLPGFSSGTHIGAFGLTEPEAGSDVSILRTTAVLEGAHYKVNGSKCFCSQANLADVICLFVKTSPEAGNQGISCLLLEKGTSGFEAARLEDKIGARGSPTAQIFLHDCSIPKENLVGRENEGFSLAMHALNHGRPLIGAMCVGLAQEALNRAVDYGKKRVAFGKPIVFHQGIQFMLADMATQIEAARQLVYKAAELVDMGSPALAGYGAMAKCFASDVAMKASIDAIQVFGGYGLLKDYAIEKYMREAKVCQVIEGTNEMQRMTIAHELLGGRLDLA
jgi:alkylation response protein AidB-like acyl-CoA dehydrogenase